jgi:hypothetical protein
MPTDEAFENAVAPDKAFDREGRQKTAAKDAEKISASA